MDPDNAQAIADFLVELEVGLQEDLVASADLARVRREKQRAKNSQHWAIAATKYPTAFSDTGGLLRGKGILSAMPKWASAEAICRVYEDARELTKKTGVPHQVDHIVPLRSALVSGLHVEFNLRPMPKAENNRKGNRHWPDMP